jgi:hypothetical protein
MSGMEVLFLLRTSKYKNAIQALHRRAKKNSICRLFKKTSEARMDRDRVRET